MQTKLNRSQTSNCSASLSCFCRLRISVLCLSTSVSKATTFCCKTPCSSANYSKSKNGFWFIIFKFWSTLRFAFRSESFWSNNSTSCECSVEKVFCCFWAIKLFNSSLLHWKLIRWTTSWSSYKIYLYLAIISTSSMQVSNTSRVLFWEVIVLI